MRLSSGLFLCLACWGQTPAPLYVPSSIANAANSLAAPLAPNTIATLYGKNLAAATRGLTPDDLVGGDLPTGLGGTGVRVSVGGIAAQLYFVSPQQINFLVPPRLKAAPQEVIVTFEGRQGPTVMVNLADVSPALFQLDPEYAVATRADGTLVDRQHRARAGDVIILYANGLGWTMPRFSSGQVARTAAPLEQLADFKVSLNGAVVNRNRILYAGIAPNFVGLYQINLQLPPDLPADPEIRIGFGDTLSPAGIHLAVEP